MECKLPFLWKLEDLIRDEHIKEEEIEEIKKWLSEQKNKIPSLPDELLACIIISCNGDQKLTQKTIKEYLSVKNNAPRLFTNRNLDREDFQKQLNVLEYSVFPERTPEGYAILYHKLTDCYYGNYNMEPAMSLLFMTLDGALYDYPPTGLIVFFDMKGVGLMHLTKVRLGLVKSFFNYLQDGLPIKLKEIHIMNVVYFIDKVMGIVKPFMKKELYDMLHLHPPTYDMDLFYEKYNIPKNCIPEDYGGELPSTKILHEENTKKLREMQEFFEIEEKMRMNC